MSKQTNATTEQGAGTGETREQLIAAIRAEAAGLLIKGQACDEAQLSQMVKRRFRVASIEAVESLDDLRQMRAGIQRARVEQERQALIEEIEQVVAVGNDQIALREYLEIECGGRGLGDLSLDELIVARDKFVATVAVGS